jgi:hypothetical protein
MLIKSRSEGNAKLRMEDRFHLEVVRVWDDADVGGGGSSSSTDATTSYRHYSRQSTAGRVASSVAPGIGDERASELLVRYPPPPPPPPAGDVIQQPGHPRRSGKRYRRLPNAMTLHDAERAGWVGEFDAVLVRVYSLVACRDGGGATMADDGEDDDRGPSKSVLDPDSDDDDGTTDGDDDEGKVGNDARICCDDDASEDQATMDVDRDNEGDALPGDAKSQRQRLLQQTVHAIFMSSLDGNTKSGGAAGATKTKKKPASKQVRNMLMKSKSTGNARIKQEDRVYIDVALFRDNDDYDATTTDVPPYSSSYRFFSKRDDLRHILATVLDGDSGKTTADVSNADATGIEFIVPCRCSNAALDGSEDGVSYLALPASLTLGDAIERGYVENFGIVIVRACNTVDEGGSYLPCVRA